jgi:O-antigen/teichoic acid export membrane protein
LLRTCIIYTLGTNFLGLSSLFTSILSVLSLAELGFGSAIVYNLYKPIANGDIIKICALINFYKYVYRCIGIFILCIGLALIPILSLLIKKDLPPNINLYVIYLIYLSNSVVSYFLFAYKNCILSSMQRVDISNKIAIIINFFISSIQIYSLLKFKNFYFFIIFIPLGTIVNNITTSIVVSKKFPYIKANGYISKNEIVDIFKQVYGLLLSRLAHVSRNAFDSIIISSLFGLTITGIYNNYFYVLNAMTGILALLFIAMQGGIGNSLAKESKIKNYLDFKRIEFIYMWISGWCSICIFSLVQNFMIIWVGNKMLFNINILLMFSLYFYSMKMTDTIGAYISSSGLWYKCKYIYIFEALTNILLNILLGKKYGVKGVILASLISVMFINFIFSALILFKCYFQTNVCVLYYDHIIYLFNTMIIGCITYYALSFFSIECNNIYLIFIFKVIFVCVFPNLLYFIFYFKNTNFINTKKWILQKKELLFNDN